MSNRRCIFWRLMRVTFLLWIGLLVLLGAYGFFADRYLDIHGDKGWAVGFIYFASLLTACYMFIVLCLIVVFWIIRVAYPHEPEKHV